MPQITVKDANGVNQTIGVITNTGSATSANSSPVCPASDATFPVSGPLTDAQLRATPVPVSGPLTDAQLRASSVVSRITALNPSGVETSIRATPEGAITTGNVTARYRTNCDSLPSAFEWNTTTGSGDIVTLDGNSNGASYWTISKSPWVTSGTETIIDGLTTFKLPFEASIGAHRSQTALSQDLSIEFVDSATPAAPTADVAISGLSQSTTTLTVTTATAHGLSAGTSIAIYGCNDSRFNYPSVVVNTVISSTSFSVTAGPAGTIQSLTASPGTLGSPFVSIRRRVGGSADGTSMIIEGNTATSASFYVRSNSGDAFVSGTPQGNHTVSIGNTTSTQTINASNSYSFYPTTEFRANIQTDKIQWHDAAPDSVAGTSPRVTRTSICPSPDKAYKLRFRAINQKGLPAPVGKIVSAVKTGTTTATVTFAAAHGLNVDDYLVGYGVRDSTNFANLTTATKVASIVSSTVITIVWGAAVTATSYGGYMARVQGGNTHNGIISQTGVSAQIVASSNAVTFTGSATWTGVSIGDYVELIGARDNTTGADLGIDGAFRVTNLATTVLTLEPLPGTTIPASLALTNCGGGVVRRTDYRISFVRIFEYVRERVEFAPRPSTDANGGIPVNVGSGNITQIATTTPLMSAPQGSTSRALMVGQGTAFSNTDQNATALAGSGRVNGTIVTSATGSGSVISSEINVSALTLGTATSIVFILQESTGGTNFTDIWFSDPITTTGILRVPPISVGGRRRWCAHSVGGTSTTVTTTITSLELPTGYPVYRQYRDAFSATNPLTSVINSATAVATTLVNTGATCMTVTTQATAPMVIEGCKISTMHVTLGNAPTVTTQPVLAIEFSQDGTNWFTSTATITGAGNGTYSASIATVAFRYARIRVTTAAVYSAGNYTITSIGITSIS